MKKRKNKVNLQKIKIKIEELIIEFREIDKLILVLDHNIIKIHSITCLKDRDFILKIQWVNKKIEIKEIEEIKFKEIFMDNLIMIKQIEETFWELDL
jgi:hypothetical protein